MKIRYSIMKCRGRLAERRRHRQQQSQLGRWRQGAGFGPQASCHRGGVMCRIFGCPGVQFLTQDFEFPSRAAIKPCKINPGSILLNEIRVQLQKIKLFGGKP